MIIIHIFLFHFQKFLYQFILKILTASQTNLIQCNIVKF